MQTLVYYLVSIPKWLIFPISASGSYVHSRNTVCMTAMTIFIFLELGKISSFMDGHYFYFVKLACEESLNPYGVGHIAGFHVLQD